MNTKTIGLLLGLLTALVLAYFLINGDGGTEAAALAPGSLAPGSDQTEGITPSNEELSKALAADSAAPTKRQEVPRQATKDEIKAAKKAEEEAERAQGPFFTGTVFGSDGMPIPDVDVKIEGSFGGGAGVVLGSVLKIAEETTTDRSGGFRVPRGRWPLQELSVELRARGFGVVRELRSPDTDSGDGNLGDFVLPRGVVLGGRVIDDNGEGVANATVRRTSIDDDGALDGMLRMASTFGRAGDQQTKTDDEGNFELKHERPGPYLLVVQHDDYPGLRQEGVAPSEGGEDLGILLRMPPTATIQGQIIGFPEGRKGVTVQAEVGKVGSDETATFAGLLGGMGMGNGQTAKVQPDGTFEIKGLAIGERYAVRATVQEGFFARAPCTETEEVQSGSTVLELDWNAGARVQFNVADEANGKALRNLTVRHRWEDQTTGMMPGMAKKLEFAGSRVSIEELRPTDSQGALEFSVYAEGYLEVRRSGIEVQALETIDLGTINLRLAPIVRVQVVDTATGKPLNKARVVLRPQQEDVEDMLEMNAEHSVGRSDRDGWCELPACSTELATLSVKKGGFASYERADIRMPKEGTSEEVARLFKGGSIEIEVVDANLDPAPEVTVIHRLPDESTKRHSTNTKGIVKLNDLEAGEHSFRAERSRGRRRRGGPRVQVGFDGDSLDYDWQTVVLTNDGDADVKIELPPTATVLGIVLLRGQPVSQARIMLAEGEESSASEELQSRMSERMQEIMPDGPSTTRTNGKGRFELNDAPMGKHRIRVARDDGSPAFYAPVTLREGENRIEIDLPSAAVEGRVVDGDGKPVAGATVETLSAPSEEDADDLAQVEMSMSFFGGGSSRGVRTDYDGTFRIEGIPPDVPLVVRAEATGYSRGQSGQFEVDDREMKRGIEIVLAASGSIRIEADETVARFQPVTAEFEEDIEEKPSPKMALLQGGAAVIRGLKPGKWRVYLTRNENDYQIVEVHAGEQSLVQLSQ